MNPYDLFEEVSNLLEQDMGKLRFMQDLIHGIIKLTDSVKEKTEIREIWLSLFITEMTRVQSEIL